MDNFAYTRWDESKFLQMLLRYSHQAESILWCSCPDVVGDWQATSNLFKVWGPKVTRLGYKTAYVLQDGQPLGGVPWTDIACVFLGGTTEFKLSQEALRICNAAKDKGKLVHIGRVNSVQRTLQFLHFDSLDGMSYSRWPKRNLPRLLRFLEKPLCQQ